MFLNHLRFGFYAFDMYGHNSIFHERIVARNNRIDNLNTINDSNIGLPAKKILRCYFYHITLTN